MVNKFDGEVFGSAYNSLRNRFESVEDSLGKLCGEVVELEGESTYINGIIENLRIVESNYNKNIAPAYEQVQDNLRVSTQAAEIMDSYKTVEAQDSASAEEHKIDPAFLEYIG